VQDGRLHGSLAQQARGLDGIATNLNDVFNGAPADVEDFLDGIAADLEHISNRTSADLEDVLDCRAAALYRVWHRFLLERLRKCSLVGRVQKLSRLRDPVDEEKPAKERKRKSGNGAISLLLHRERAQS
jgi:gamma-glutamyl phosphate reductase